MIKLPRARNANIVVQNLRDETLIYDLETNQAFCLNDTAAKVFNHCDGATTFAELKAKYQLTDEIIFFSLDGLKKENLIEANYASPFAGMTRREVIRKVGLASMIILPVISVLSAPNATAAASTCQRNVCLPAGSILCSGCEGMVISYNFYTSTNGTCTGFINTISDVPCSSTVNSPTARDIRRF